MGENRITEKTRGMWKIVRASVSKPTTMDEKQLLEEGLYFVKEYHLSGHLAIDLKAR